MLLNASNTFNKFEYVSFFLVSYLTVGLKINKSSKFTSRNIQAAELDKDRK